MAQLRSHYLDIKAAGAEVLLVTFAPTEHTRNWAHHHKLPYLLGCDPTRETYFRYGLGDAKMLDLVGPQAAIAGIRAFVRRGIVPTPNAFYEQTGGYFIVSNRGEILYSHPSRGPADHPSIDDLLVSLGVVTPTEQAS